MEDLGSAHVAAVLVLIRNGLLNSNMCGDVTPVKENREGALHAMVQAGLGHREARWRLAS